MKKYYSRYKKIIEIKDLFLKQAEERLNYAILHLQKVEMELEAEQKNLEEAYRFLEQLLREEKLNLFFIGNQHLVIDNLKEKIRHKKTELVTAQEEVEQKKKDYFEAKREKKKIEILEGKQREKFKKYQQKEEIKFLDDIGNRKVNDDV